MGQVGLLEEPPAGTGRPGGLVLQGAFLTREKADFGPGSPGCRIRGCPGGCQAWLAFLGIYLPEALPCWKICLDLGLLLLAGPGQQTPAGIHLALGIPARPVLALGSH